MKKQIFASIIVFMVLMAFGSTLVSAQQGQGSSSQGTGQTSAPSQPVSITIDNPFKGGTNSLVGLLEKIIQEILMPIGGVLAVLAFIYSGFLYVTAQGNETKLKSANTALLYTAIGTAVLLGSWVLAKVIANTIDLIRAPN